MIHDDIRHLLEAPASGQEAPSLDHIEHTLTAGYARALALEGERWHLERKISEIAARLGEELNEQQAAELANLGRRLSTADRKLTQLRGLLASLRTRADELRATAA
jgi:DNA repair exonuclease SbcCD ATPase subunit